MVRVKRRYILFKIEPLLVDSSQKLGSITEGSLVRVLRDKVHQLHGDFGLASILLNFHSKMYDDATRTGVLVAKRESYHFLLTALPLVRSIQDKEVSISILKLTGTLRGCLRALQGYHGKMIHLCRRSIQKKGNFTERPAISSTEQIDQAFDNIAKSLQTM